MKWPSSQPCFNLIEGLGEAGVKRSLEEKVGGTSVETSVETQVETQVEMRVETPDRIIELLRAHPLSMSIENCRFLTIENCRLLGRLET